MDQLVIHNINDLSLYNFGCVELKMLLRNDNECKIFDLLNKIH